MISESEQRTTRTLAGPSQGSAEISTWRVEIGADASAPVHIIDKEQVWMPVSGMFEAVVDGDAEQVKAGQAIVLPAGKVRQLTAVGGPAVALVAMAVGGMAMLPGSQDKVPLPWAR
ncbi:cupin domain-containing protein [Peterkaempfera bronchialis]|uniref:cupin domain-containing protein n=1 Tax=Peterkaempfera bronchialis TaxID=2126346 RepID=UPI001E2955DC|nr:cupin [Peterkaempfera bronchialis]